ncbi:MAG: hypothetical protein U1F81_00540 [Verrucomicrobiaceae bacterium]
MNAQLNTILKELIVLTAAAERQNELLPVVLLDDNKEIIVRGLASFKDTRNAVTLDNMISPAEEQRIKSIRLVSKFPLELPSKNLTKKDSTYYHFQVV